MTVYCTTTSYAQECNFNPGQIPKNSHQVISSNGDHIVFLPCNFFWKTLALFVEDL